MRPHELHGILRQAALATGNASQFVPWAIIGGCWSQDILTHGQRHLVNQSLKYTRTLAPGGGWLMVARTGTPRGSRCVGAYSVGSFGAVLILRRALV